jgi:hypothetical protein
MVELNNSFPFHLPPLLDEDDQLVSRTKRNVLSSELRSNFESIRRLFLAQGQRRKHRSDEVEVSSGAKKRRRLTGDDNLGSNDTDKISDANESIRFRLAVSTYNMVENEILRLTNGITELEALIGAESQDESEEVYIVPSGTHDLRNDDIEDEDKE